MSNASDVLYEILQLQLSPWLDDTGSDEKYTAKLAGVKEKQPAIPLKYKIDFPRPFNNKTKYYVRLISNAVVDMVSENITQIAGETDESIILFLLDEILDKNLKNRIRRVGELIKEMDYAPVYISNNFVATPENSDHKANAYIIQFLKLAYMQIYLEIQDEFKHYRGDILIAEDFYSQLLNEPVPDHIPLSKVKVIEVEGMPVEEVKKSKPSPQVSITSFTLLDFDKSQDNLADAFDRLKNKEFIHKETTLPTFKKVFSGKEISTPVRWIGNASDLYYFIKLIYSVNKLVKDLKQKQWDVACKCFVDQDGNAFDKDRIRLLKKPATTADQLEFIVSMMK